MAKFREGAKGELGAFRKFVSRGNVLDMAVGVIVGGAFGKIVTSLVNDIVMPLVGVALGGLDFKSLSVSVGSAVVAYGKFIQSVVDFLIIAACVFAVVRVFERFRRKAPPAPPARSEEARLLEEIRDLLKSRGE